MIGTSPSQPAVVTVAATRQATLPIPRGVALRAHTPNAADSAGQSIRWKQVTPIAGLDGWYQLAPASGSSASVTSPTTPGGASAIRNLASFWMALRELRGKDGITEVHPLLGISNPQPATQVDAEAFSMGAGQFQFGGWSAPYDHVTSDQIYKQVQRHDWHLRQLHVREAWAVWGKSYPNSSPGDGVRIAQLDTGTTSHPAIQQGLDPTGRSFLLRKDQIESDARDDLHLDSSAFVQFPGHGTAAAGAIIAASYASPESKSGTEEVYGVAPGATVIPYRVSRSTQTCDFSATGEAILAAIAERADVISVSVGSPIYSGFLHECVRQAQRQGIIVVASAGAAVPATAFPAALPEVVGVAATNAAGSPWRFSGSGRFIDVAAPGERVWCPRASVVRGTTKYQVRQTSSTGIATGCIAGLAAMWLAYHRGRAAVASFYSGRSELIPMAFKLALTRSLDDTPAFAEEGMYGAGIPDAEKLLSTALPSLEQVERYAEVVGQHGVPKLALASDGFASGVDGGMSAIASETEVLTRLIGTDSGESGEELLARIAADRISLVYFRRVQQGENALPLLAHVLNPASEAPSSQASDPDLSQRLRVALIATRDREKTRAGGSGAGELTAPVSTVYPDASARGRPLAPAFRNLRVYAFDPSLDTKLETAPITQVTIRTPWEATKPGPVGEYLEVIDVDPASGCAYTPIDLDDPHVLAQSGMPPSEGDPNFHQQMVYAVAMNTIQHFERALGRPIFWSPLRPWLEEVPQEEHHFTSEALDLLGYSDNIWVRRANWQRERYVQRLRIYPHALRESNAYYSPSKRALLFGYFPASAIDTGTHYPGGMVFTCLSHDIIAHETTHAVLDGMHPYFNEPSNEDVWAFHEAFADIVALLQHFTYPDVLRHQIANTRGDLETDNLLAQLAQQFGQATGRRGALRDALGKPDKKGLWTRQKADPHKLRKLREPHERGGILIAAVFNAFLDLYNDRVADLLRIYTGGTGVLPAGQLHPDLINRLAIEAADIAERVLRICIRAMDYMPPVDPTFGEFLRALITADYDLSPHEGRRNRIAFIDAFRSWGIYPPDVATLSEDSLRWQAPPPGSPLTQLDLSSVVLSGDADQTHSDEGAGWLLDALDAWQRRYDVEAAVSGTGAPPIEPPGGARARIFKHSQVAQLQLHQALAAKQAGLRERQSLVPGLDLRSGARFSVGNLRPAQRVGSHGEYRTELVVEIVQTLRSRRPAEVPARGGATLIVDLRTWNVRYVIYKRLYASLSQSPSEEPALVNRIKRLQSAVQLTEAEGTWGEASSFAAGLASTYACEPRALEGRIRAFQDERFALLHRGNDLW